LRLLDLFAVVRRSLRLFQSLNRSISSPASPSESEGVLSLVPLSASLYEIISGTAYSPKRLRSCATTTSTCRDSQRSKMRSTPGRSNTSRLLSLPPSSATSAITS
jgi:hypothetical protein